MCVFFFFFFKQKTAYELRISDWSSDVCSSDLLRLRHRFGPRVARRQREPAHLRYRLAAQSKDLRGLALTITFNKNKVPNGGVALHGKHPRPPPLKGATSPMADRKSTRLTPVTNAHLVCRLLLEKKNNNIQPPTP